MQRSSRQYLEDILEYGQHVRQFTQGMSFEGYLADRRTRAAVERCFTVIGEALGQAIRLSPSLQERVTDAGRIIGFRNILAHGYAVVDDHTVWGIVERYLPRLLAEVRAELDAANRDDPDHE